MGGLGSREGIPVSYNWTVPSLGPLLFPWLAILALLMLKANRCAQAWWIWIPLGCIAVPAMAFQSLFDFVPWLSMLSDFLEVFSALAFGLAAVWLLSAHLARQRRLLTFLCVLPALAGFSAITYTITQGSELAVGEIRQLGIFLLLFVIAVPVSLTLASLLCRRRYGPLRLSLCVIASLLAVWTLVIGIFFVILTMPSPNRIPILELFRALLFATGISFALLLPFLILSFSNSLFRERLKMLLHLQAEAPPVLIPPLRVSGSEILSKGP